MSLESRLAEFSSLCDGATPGVWSYEENHRVICLGDEDGSFKNRIATMDGGYFDGASTQKNDALFISAARSALPLLIEIVKIQQNALEKLRSVNTGKHYIPGVIDAMELIEKMCEK